MQKFESHLIVELFDTRIRTALNEQRAERDAPQKKQKTDKEEITVDENYYRYQQVGSVRLSSACCDSYACDGSNSWHCIQDLKLYIEDEKAAKLGPYDTTACYAHLKQLKISCTDRPVNTDTCHLIIKVEPGYNGGRDLKISLMYSDNCEEYHSDKIPKARFYCLREITDKDFEEARTKMTMNWLQENFHFYPKDKKTIIYCQ